MTTTPEQLAKAITRLGLTGWQADIARLLCLGQGILGTASELRRDEVWIQANLHALYDTLRVSSPQELIAVVANAAADG